MTLKFGISYRNTLSKNRRFISKLEGIFQNILVIVNEILVRFQSLHKKSILLIY